MSENENIQEFFSRVTIIVNQIRSYGDTIKDIKIVQKILRSLPAKYDHIVVAIEEAKDLTPLTLTELMGSLQAHEERIRRFDEQPLEQAFQAKLKFSNNGVSKNKNSHSINYEQKGGWPNNRDKGRGFHKKQGDKENGQLSLYCKLCKKNNHNTKDCRFKCKKCKRHTHLEKDCWFKQKDEANFVEKDEPFDQLFYSCLKTHQETQDTWYVDSGCSNHMTGDKNSFVKLDENIKSQITLGDGRTQDIKGKGTISVGTKNGSSKFIHDVLCTWLCSKFIKCGTIS